MTQRGRKLGGEGRWQAVRLLGTRLSLAVGLAVLLSGCAGTVATGYVDDPYYQYGYSPYPYDGDVYVDGYPHYYHRRYVPEYRHRGMEDYHPYERHQAAGPHVVPHAGGFRGTSRGTGHGSGDPYR